MDPSSKGIVPNLETMVHSNYICMSLKANFIGIHWMWLEKTNIDYRYGELHTILLECNNIVLKLGMGHLNDDS